MKDEHDITLLSTQPDHIGEVTEMVVDTISRQGLINAVEEVPWYHQNDSGDMVHGANSAEHQAWYKAEDIYKAIEGVPSALPLWISVTERLPKVRQDVLMQFAQNIAVGFLSHKNWNVNTGNGLYTSILESDDQPIAWMPIPWERGQDGN